MRTRLHYKQILLFLIAVILPSSVLIVLTWRMIGQQEELSEKRQADERRRLAREIGQKLLVRLEEIKLHEVSTTASGAESLNSLAYTSPEVVLIGLTDGEQLRLPWEMDQAKDRRGQSVGDTTFCEKIRRAEQEEFARKQWDQASILYRECMEEAGQPAQQAYARLARARVLVRADHVDEGLAEYRKILDVSATITDEDGVPFCLYAAGRLLERGASYDRIAQLIETALDTPRWLSPAESYLIRDLLDMLVESGSALGAPSSGCRELSTEDSGTHEPTGEGSQGTERLSEVGSSGPMEQPNAGTCVCVGSSRRRTPVGRLGTRLAGEAASGHHSARSEGPCCHHFRDSSFGKVPCRRQACHRRRSRGRALGTQLPRSSRFLPGRPLGLGAK